MRRVYHLLSCKYALDDLRRRRLKIARLDELNDPFELWAIAQPNRKLRRAFGETKKEMAEHYGMLCFSLSWRNPLLWSHYADRHRGIALGFDIDERICLPVEYIEHRPVLNEINMQVANWLLFTKFMDWQYEQEARIFVTLEDRDPDSGLYFAEFSEQLLLREIITGPLCTATKSQLRDAVADVEGVNFTKARLAFNSFEVVANQRGFSPIHSPKHQPKHSETSILR